MLPSVYPYGQPGQGIDFFLKKRYFLYNVF